MTGGGGGVSSYIAVHCYKYVEKYQRIVPKSTCAHLKLSTNSESKKRVARKQNNNHPEKKKPAARVRRGLNRDSICAQKRAKYALGEPKLDVKDMYVKNFLSHLLADAEARSLASDSFPKCI